MTKKSLLVHINNIDKLEKELIRSFGTGRAYDNLIEIYEYFKEIAPEFYENGQMDWNYKVLLHELQVMERTFLPNDKILYYTPHDFDHERKVDSTCPESILDYIVHKTRKYLYDILANEIGKRFPYDGLDLEGECQNSAWFVYDLAKALRLDAKVEILVQGFQSLSLENDAGGHCFTIISIQGKKYLIDCTYSQFFLYRRCISEKLGVPLSSKCSPGKFMMMSESRRKVAQKILEDGWIELTDDVLKDYLDGFALSYRNGLYYENTGDFSFVTPYTAQDYRDFLENENNQADIEGKENIGFQLRPLKDTKMKFHF